METARPWGSGPQNHEAVTDLLQALGPTLVAALAGTPDRRDPERWARGTARPSREQVQRVEMGWGVWQEVAAAEGADVARAWVIGANPWLGDASPIQAIREGREAEVRTAARAIIDGTWSG